MIREHTRSLLLGLAAVAALATLTACSGSGSDILVPADIGTEVGSITIEPTTLQTIEVGASVQFSAIAVDPSGAPTDHPDITWSSTDPNVATVTQDGLATGLTEGRTEITASSGGVQATALLRVATPPLTQSSQATLSGRR
ncbi:MAG: Ig-like domain-containing protein [Gemmatimonadota bacterium]|jgi:uncharacterized protein YjdB